MKFGDITQDALIKGGLDMYNQIEVATKKLLMGNSFNYDMRRLKDTSGAEFAITASGADAKLIAVYKRFSSLEAYYKKIGCGLKPSLLKNKVEIQHQEIIDGKYMFTVCSDETIEKIINLKKRKRTTMTVILIKILPLLGNRKPLLLMY